MEAALLALPEQGEARGAPRDEALERLLGHLGEPGPRRVVGRDRQLAPVAPLAQEALGHLVEEVAPLEGLDPPALLGLGRRLQAQHVLEQVQEAAAGVGGEPAGRDGKRDRERVEPRRERLVALAHHEAVVAREPARPAGLAREAGLPEERRAGRDRGRRRLVAAQAEPVALARVDRVLEREAVEVVLDDEALELGPGQRPAGERRGGGGEEERRQALAAGARVGPRVGEDEALGGLRHRAVEEAAGLEEAVLGGRHAPDRVPRQGACRESRRRRDGLPQSLAKRKGELGRPTDLRERGAREEEARGTGGSLERRREPLSGWPDSWTPSATPLRVEEEWIRPKHPRIAALHEPRDRHHAEGQAGHRVEGADVDGAALRRLEGQALPLEAGLDHLLDLVPAGARGHRAEAAEVGDHLEDGLAVALGADPLVDDRAQPLDPLRPRGLAGEARRGSRRGARRRAGAPPRRPRGGGAARGGRRPSPPPRPRAPPRPTRAGRRSSG